MYVVSSKNETCTVVNLPAGRSKVSASKNFLLNEQKSASNPYSNLQTISKIKL
jgi:hypothetical protein